MIDFKCKTISNAITVVEVRGLLDSTSRKYFFDYVGELFTNNVKHVVIDCSGLGFLSSAGMSALLTSRKRAQKRGGKIYLTHLNAKVASALEYTRLSTLLAIFPTTRDLVERLCNFEPAGC